MSRADEEPSGYDYATERWSIEGLSANVEILIDHWGVPHIYASSLHDVFVAQGWNAARDRLWQIDFWRRRGLGEMAAAFGPAYVEHDRASRLFAYRGDMEREWTAYGPDANAHTEAFVTGINAYVAAARSDATLRPSEFSLGGYDPAFWTAEDVVRVRNHAVVAGGAARQLMHAQMFGKVGALGSTDLPVKISPPWTPIVPEGVDLSSIPSNVLDLYHLATLPVVLNKDTPSTSEAAMRVSTSEAIVHEGNLLRGSNNWVLAASKTTTGRPILASDPHRSLDVPSLRYLVHLVAPGLNVIGAGQPSLPGIETGHNEHIAFGFTVFSIAQEDLCVYTTCSVNSNQYRYGDEWESMRVLRETITVRGGPDVHVELKFTRHGPVLLEDPDQQRAYALRAAWLDAGGAPYLGALAYLQAKDREEFSAALSHWGGPGENHLCADTGGRIGWFPAGFTPIRRNSDGLLPLPGDGRYEWDGYLDRDLLPSERDPVRGFIASANQMNLPDGYPYDERRVGFVWPDGSRFNRIRAVLDGPKKVSLEDCQALQNDHLTLPGRRLIQVLGEIPIPSAEIRDTARWLREWDGQVRAESPQAALYEVWLTHHLVPGVLSRVAPEVPETARVFAHRTVIAELMAFPDLRLGADPERARDELMFQTLSDAVAEIKQLLGSDQSRWAWGRLATVLLEHPLSPLVNETLRAEMNVGPGPCSGDSNSVAMAFYRSADFRVQMGASVRLVMDVGHWDHSVAINTPGQSGEPSSRHYRDLFPLWLEGKYFPLAYSREAVEKVTARRIVLEPTSCNGNS